MVGYNKTPCSEGIMATSGIHLGVYLKPQDGTSIGIRVSLTYVLNKGLSIDIGFVIIALSPGIVLETGTTLK